MNRLLARLGDVAVIERRGVEPHALSADTRYVGLEHIERGGRITGSATVGTSDLASTKFLFDARHVLFGKLRPNLAKVARPGFDGVCSTDILPVLPRDELDRGYLHHYLLQPRVVRWAASHATGANLPRLSPGVLENLEIPLPPLDEQRRTAAILDQADALRSKRRQSLAALDMLAESIVMQALDKVGADMWRPFQDLCDRVTVGVVVKPASYYAPTGVPALRTLNVKRGQLDLSDLVFFSAASNDGPLSKSKLRADDVVIARTGRPGTAARVPAELDGANAIDLIVVTPNPRQTLSVYLEGLMNSVIGRRIVQGEQRGQIQQHFNVGSLKAALVPVPHMDDQKHLSRQLLAVRKQQRSQRRQAAELDALLTSLEDAAFGSREDGVSAA